MRSAGMRLVGRDAECRRIDGLLAAARAGHGGALLLEGEAGIGKTSLLDYAVARSGDLRVLRTHGCESETELAFCGLSDVLQPLARHLSGLPSRQAGALAGALGIGPPVAGDRFAVAAATLGILALASDDGPLLVVVDDLQWLDTSSAEALLFAARRIANEPVGVLLARREGWGRHLDHDAIPTCSLGGLDRSATAALLARVAPVTVADAVVEELHLATRGNPMALIAAARSLPIEQLEGREALGPMLPAGEQIEQAVASVVGGLPAGTRDALLVAAASGHRDLDVVVGGLRELGLTPAALDPAELAGLIEMDDEHVAFRHPLVRSCLYQGSPSAQRRAAHAALARALEGRGDEWLDARAWHLAAAAAEPDESTARELEAVALGASGRSGYWSAARAFERSARLSPDPEPRVRRLIAAAEAWDLAGQPDHARPLLDEAAASTRDPLVAASVNGLRTRLARLHGLRDEAAADGDPGRRADAVDRARGTQTVPTDGLQPEILGDDLTAIVEAGRRALELARPVGGTPCLLAEIHLGAALVLAGDTGAGYPLLMRCRELLAEPDPGRHAAELAQCTPALLTVGEEALAARILERVVDACRAAGAVALLPYVLGAQEEVEALAGRWEAAEANGFESVHLARATHQDAQLSYNLARLGRLEAALGKEEACRAHIAEAVDLATARRFGPTFAIAASALGLLELGLGRPESAIGHLEEASRWWSHMGFRHPGRLLWQQDLVEACIRAGRVERAVAALDSLDEIVAACARPVGDDAAGRPVGGLAGAGAARCRGMLAHEGDVDAWFGMALGLHDACPAPFERARTECAYGEQLRRHGRRVDARPHLRAALEVFEHLGAVPWARRARTELAATGVAAPPAPAEADRRLTPQEVQVARLVARGATNKEAAAALFLTPRTIEFHLSQVYRKLGLRSRSELAHRFAEPPGEASDGWDAEDHVAEAGEQAPA